MACTFSGDEAEQQARRLVLEFRQRFNIAAYAHAMEFDLEKDGAVGRGLDERGAPVRMRYRKGRQLLEWAVLAGDFPSIDDPEAQKLLKTIKGLRPDALTPGADGQTAQSLAYARLSQAVFVPRIGKSKRLGPMRTAFMARNPMLPQEYFVPKGVDKFVEKMNRDLPHSLLDNKRKYTVKVASFDGQGVLEGAKNTPRAGGRGRSPLEVAVDNAEILAKLMHDAGYEAYSFHNREESIVTVGGFDAATLRQLDGSHAPVPEIAGIIQTFGAAFNTPQEPLKRAAITSDAKQKVEETLAHFNQRFQPGPSSVAAGMNPKFVSYKAGGKTEVIPFDVYPQVIEVPRRSISANFAWRR
ncbi:MAG: hypothetical protein AAGB00_10725 [Planctomycetota bacterium]